MSDQPENRPILPPRHYDNGGNGPVQHLIRRRPVPAGQGSSPGQTAQMYFPPPPRNPNRPPELPPRPQQVYPQPTYTYNQPATAQNAYLQSHSTPPMHNTQAPTYPSTSQPLYIASPDYSGSPQQPLYSATCDVASPPPPPPMSGTVYRVPGPTAFSCDQPQITAPYASNYWPAYTPGSYYPTQSSTHEIPTRTSYASNGGAYSASNNFNAPDVTYGQGIDERGNATHTEQIVSLATQPSPSPLYSASNHDATVTQSYEQPATAGPPPLSSNTSQVPLLATQQNHDGDIQAMNHLLESMSITSSYNTLQNAQQITSKTYAEPSTASNGYVPLASEKSPQPTSGPETNSQVPHGTAILSSNSHNGLDTTQGRSASPRSHPLALDASTTLRETHQTPNIHSPSAQGSLGSESHLQPQSPLVQASQQHEAPRVEVEVQWNSETWPKHGETASFHPPTPQQAEYVRNLPPPRPVTSCIDNPATFHTTWYTHDQAPGTVICSKCYVDYIWPTQFRDQFIGKFYSDGVSRRCRFKAPRIVDRFLYDAIATGTLQPLLGYMNHRHGIPDCKGQNGAKGTEGIKWFRAQHDAIPGLVFCEACYEDVVLTSPLAQHFESALGQVADQAWSCDMALPFIKKEFLERSQTADWSSFTREAKARLGMPACSKGNSVLTSSRKWFKPVNGPHDVSLCMACYCDRILKSGQETYWENKPGKAGQQSVCCLGQFNILMAVEAAEDANDWSLFWRAIEKLAYQEKLCDPKGTKSPRWFTFPSYPDGFAICGACHAGIVEPLFLAHFFVPKVDISPDSPVLCSLNIKAPRFGAYVDKMLETWFTQDSTSWERYAQKYASISKCPRDDDCKDRIWYGWNDCVICPECYLEFVSGTALDTPTAMPFRGVLLNESHICEMYSPRMRQLYHAACSLTPPDPTDLLAYSIKRRLVYVQTMPTCRRILMEQMFISNQATMARIMSVTYTGMGNLESASSAHRPDHTYGQAGVGYGYDNMDSLIGARYNVQANNLAAQVGGNKILLVGELERQWRAVE